jgi:hypothetical protein
MISKPDHAVGKVWLWSKNKNSLVRITPSFSRMPTFGPTAFDQKPKNPKTIVDLGACPFQKPLINPEACPSIL